MDYDISIVVKEEPIEEQANASIKVEHQSYDQGVAQSFVFAEPLGPVLETQVRFGNLGGKGVPVGNIESLPVRVKLEKDLTPPEKIRRLWNPTGSTPEMLVSQPDFYVPGMFVDNGTSAASSSWGGGNAGTGNFNEAPSSMIKSENKTPRATADVNQCSRVLRDIETFNVLQYGSESESDSDPEEEVVQTFNVPRVFQFLNIDTPQDEEPAPSLESAVAEDNNMCNAYDNLAQDATTAAATDLNLYHFEWRPLPNPPISPGSRREKFYSVSGPTIPMIDPYDIFVYIWDRPFMEYIASETNRYAQQLTNKLVLNNTLGPNSRLRGWQDTDCDELYVYFAIILAMGVLVKTNMIDYWNVTTDVFLTPGFRVHMSLRRFQLLHKCLHFANFEDMCGRNLDVSEAKLFKIAPVVEHLNHRFSSMYNLSQNISLDESLLQWKGCLSINQVISNKVAKVGIKCNALCESQTGYLWRFRLHAHSKASQQPSAAKFDPVSGTTALVLDLVSGLEHKGHTLWMDHYYNSPALARRLKSIGFDVVGTLRTKRRFVPNELSSLTKDNMKRGDIVGFTSGDVDLLVWRDQNRVGLISTYHGNAVSGDTPKPTLVADYNVCMGGVDKKDQMLAMYPIERKRTKVWYKKLFRHLLNTSVLNGYIIHKESSNLVTKSTQARNSNKLSHRQFRVLLINSLLSKHQRKGHKVLPLVPGLTSEVFEVKDHYVVEFPIHESKTGGKNNGRVRRSCTVCRKRTQYYCDGCKKPSCLFTCFRKMHS